MVLPGVYVYSTDTVKDREGRTLPIDADLTSVVYFAGVVKVTTKKILGGYYGFQVLFPIGANNRLQGTEIDQNPGAGITDSLVQPISLGWHFKRADATVGYNIYVPNGRYTAGASNNTGLGQWTNEVFVGTTVYWMRPSSSMPRRWPASTFHRRKKTAKPRWETRCISKAVRAQTFSRAA